MSTKFIQIYLIEVSHSSLKIIPSIFPKKLPKKKTSLHVNFFKLSINAHLLNE